MRRMKTYLALPCLFFGLCAFAWANSNGHSEGDGSAYIPGTEGRMLREFKLRTELAESAEASLSLAPDWLRMDLSDMFTRLPSEDQEAYGLLLLSIADPRLIDEVAFSIAHSSARILTETDPQLYARNAELLYQISEEVPYAEIIDQGEPGVDPDFYSTVRYQTKRGGVMGQYELPMDVYYWEVAHPRLPEEIPSMSSDAADDDFACGYLWREYLFYNPSDEYDYSTNFMATTPNRIYDSDVSGWGRSASGYLSDGGRTCPDGIVAAGPAWEMPTLIEYSLGYCRVVVTTMELERAHAMGKTELLENLIMRSGPYGNDLLLPPHDPNGSYVNPDQVVILDTSGNQEMLGPITSVLDSHEIIYWVNAPDDLYDASWDTIRKVIIPSHQDWAFYESIADSQFMDKFNVWAGRVSGVLEFHGACDIGDSWSGLQLFGLRYNPEPLDDLSVFGYPVLGDVIGNADYFWDDTVTGAVLPGNRPFESGAMALDVVTNWVSRNMAFKRKGSHWLTQSNEICYGHGGYCGEIGHLLNAAARTCLLPSATVCDYVFDHVSNEFWEGEWRGYEVGWEVGSSIIASQNMISSDAYAVVHERADMYSINATSRFTPVCRFHATVQDLFGNPVDCAMVRVWVPLGGSDGVFGNPIADYTDSRGEAVLELGDNHDYWFEVRSASGNLDRQKILANTQADMDYMHTFTVDGPPVPQMPAIEPIEFASTPEPAYRLNVSFAADYETIYSLSRMTFSIKKESSANIDFFVLNGENFTKYKAGEPFSAYEWRNDIKADEFEVEIPDQVAYYLIFSNEDTHSARQFVTINLSVSENQDGAWNVIEDFETFEGIPAGKAYIITLNNRTAPSVYAAGFFEAEVNSAGGFEFGIQALVLDPDSACDIAEVELCYAGIPLGKVLTDDGLSGDAVAGDGIFTLAESYLPDMISPGVYPLEVAVSDIAGNSGVPWPYLRVGSVQIALTAAASPMNPNVYKPVATAEGAPRIIGGGFFGADAIDPGDVVRIVVFVEDPDGLSDIDRVELYLEGGIPTGLSLNDDGIDGDDQAGDALFTFQTALPEGLPSSDMTLEVVAFDKSGNSSARYPYFTIR
ncbi:MAG: hypothetical protein JW941_01385 [Candidatus Coatesbacteria bacterium]|nr:hypothetical protein [Candidatus Coatesbacteria bacterium]